MKELKYFYKIEDNKIKTGSGFKIPEGFIKYDKSNPPKEILDLQFNKLKISKKHEIESIYNTKSQEPIEYQLDSTHNYTFQADNKSQDIITKVITSAPEGFEIDWLDINNNSVHLTLDNLKQLAGLILTRSQEIFAKKVTLKKQVDSVTSADDLENIK